VVGADDGLEFSMNYLLAAFNVRRALAQGDLPSAFSSTSVALSLLLQAAQVFPQGGTAYVLQL
jgi:hypothetical protein